MLRLLRRLVQLGVMALVAAELAGLAQASHPFFDALGHFRLHLAVLLLLGLLALVILRSWRLSGLAGLAVVAGLVNLGPVISSQGPAGNGRVLTLLQFNTLFRNPTPLAIVDQVHALRPDVITLQEVSPNTSAILRSLQADYSQISTCHYGTVGDAVVLSRWPAVSQGCAETRGLAWMVLDIEGRRVTVASLHLHWPYPYRQYSQIAEIEPVLQTLPQPVVLAGDFNAAPWSEAISRIAEAVSSRVAGGLRLSFRLSPFGTGPWPVLPLDHVLLPEGATAEVTLLPGAGSDHLPLLARIWLP